MRRALVIGFAIATFGCRTAAPPAAEAAAPAPAVEDRQADIETCITGLQHPLEPTLYVASCASLWLNPTCRTAWSEALDKPSGERGEYVIDRCANAYCPSLDPAPRLCEMDTSQADLLARDPDWLQLWTEFNAVALSRDLGLPDGDGRGSAIARRLLQSLAMSGLMESTNGN